MHCLWMKLVIFVLSRPRSLIIVCSIAANLGLITTIALHLELKLLRRNQVLVAHQLLSKAKQRSILILMQWKLESRMSWKCGLLGVTLVTFICWLDMISNSSDLQMSEAVLYPTV